MNRTKQIVAVAAVMCGIAAALAHAKGSGAQQPAGAKRTVLLRQDLAGFAGHEGVLVITEIPAGTKEPRHIHPGDTFVYVQEGAITLTRDGMGTTTVKAGESFVVPAGTVHWAENQGMAGVRMVVTFVVEKGQPLTKAVE